MRRARWTCRPTAASHFLLNRTNIQEIQELLGHKSLETTMIYTHILKQGGEGVPGPLDDL